MALLIFVAAIAASLLVLELFQAPRVVIYVVATIEVLPIPMVFARLCRFEG